VEGLPADPAARREWLERWAAEQERRISARTAPSPRRIGPAPDAERIRRAFTRWQWQVVSASRRFALPVFRRVLDRRLNTSGDSYQPEHDHPDRRYYVASAWHVLPRALHYLGVSDRDTFVEFGCGKGRVVHQAARRPFRRVIGVEISPVLAEIARAGLAARRHQHRCGDVEIVVSDVTEFRVPDDLTIGYSFDPFSNETFDAILRGIVDSIDRAPRRVRLIYVHPWQGSRVLSTRRFRLLKELRGGLRDARVYRAAIFESC
jgi:SAM-dependent methyltransferase